VKKKNAIIVDLDGTLADVGHRVHHVEAQEKSWKEFHDLMTEDALNHWCHDLIKAMRREGHPIIFLTGRSDSYRPQTIEWLAQHTSTRNNYV
jgi:hydroxymethylpyrimidine pyrophosphatase-like HAD family hydrolase